MAASTDNDMGVYLKVANNIHHGSCDKHLQGAFVPADVRHMHTCVMLSIRA